MRVGYADDWKVHESLKGVVVDRVVRVIGYGLLAIACALIVSDVLFAPSSESGELLVAAVALISVSAVGLVSMRTVQRATSAVSMLQNGVLQDIYDRSNPGAIQAEIACLMRIGDDLDRISGRPAALLHEIALRHPMVELRAGVGEEITFDVEVAARSVERLVWDARESGAGRILLAAKSTGASIVFVVIDDGSHREMPQALNGLQKVGRIGLGRKYDGGCVASTIEVAVEEPAFQTAPQARPALTI